MIFSAGLASSCSPRAFIMSTIFCGRGTTVRFCTPGGVTLLVAVVFALSFVCWQPARIRSRAQHATAAARENFGNVIVVLQKKPAQIFECLIFTVSLITKSGQGTSPARLFVECADLSA